TTRALQAQFVHLPAHPLPMLTGGARPVQGAQMTECDTGGKAIGLPIFTHLSPQLAGEPVGKPIAMGGGRKALAIAITATPVTFTHGPQRIVIGIESVAQQF